MSKSIASRFFWRSRWGVCCCFVGLLWVFYSRVLVFSCLRRIFQGLSYFAIPLCGFYLKKNKWSLVWPVIGLSKSMVYDSCHTSKAHVEKHRDCREENNLRWTTQTGCCHIGCKELRAVPTWKAVFFQRWCRVLEVRRVRGSVTLSNITVW